MVKKEGCPCIHYSVKAAIIFGSPETFNIIFEIRDLSPGGGGGGTHVIW